MAWVALIREVWYMHSQLVVAAQSYNYKHMMCVVMYSIFKKQATVDLVIKAIIIQWQTSQHIARFFILR